MNALPPELVELIIYDIWRSEMPSWKRQSFMTTCPRINRTWKYAYAHIVSRDIYITSLRYLYYLCDVACRRKSIIYDDLVPRLTRTISCFADLDKLHLPDSAAIRVYNLLVQLPNYIGFRTLFPLAEYISLEVKWIGGLRFTDDTEIHGFPFHLAAGGICRNLRRKTFGWTYMFVSQTQTLHLPYTAKAGLLPYSLH